MCFLKLLRNVKQIQEMKMSSLITQNIKAPPFVTISWIIWRNLFVWVSKEYLQHIWNTFVLCDNKAKWFLIKSLWNLSNGYTVLLTSLPLMWLGLFQGYNQSSTFSVTIFWVEAMRCFKIYSWKGITCNNGIMLYVQKQCLFLSSIKKPSMSAGKLGVSTPSSLMQEEEIGPNPSLGVVSLRAILPAFPHMMQEAAMLFWFPENEQAGCIHHVPTEAAQPKHVSENSSPPIVVPK